jgi:hypothetical protein
MFDNSKIYIFGKRRYGGTFTYETNQKILYVYVRDKSSITPSLLFSTFTGGIWGIQNCDLGHWMNNVSWVSGEWYTEEWELRNSSGLNLSDGVILYIRNGTKEVEQLDARYRCSGEEGYLSDFYISNYSDTPVEIWEDDLYIDTTWARVMICTGSQWNSKGICEIQIPSAWSANSVTITANQGSFASGQQAYLYVVDSTGAVNANGFPVTIGGGGDTMAPANPYNLNVR